MTLLTAPQALEALEVSTPERVALGLPLAGIGYRCLAYLVDLVVLFLFWVSLYFVYSLLESDPVQRIQSLSRLGLTLLVLATFATQWIYWTVCEVAIRGQTVGKRALGIRVVRSDGSPVGFFESAVRNLCRAVDFLPAFYAAGVLTMLLTRHHLRLGDLLAGTILVREERLDLSRYETAKAGSPALARLSPKETELALEFLARAASLEREARHRLGVALVERLGHDLPPARLAAARTGPESAEAVLRELVAGAPQ